MSKKILVLYTGGTIGMQQTLNGYAPVAGFRNLLDECLHERMIQQLPDFEILELDQLIDSSNLIPAHWTQIAQAIESRWQDYDGFIVLHGTDTMAYTASALSFMFRGNDKPIILTGSQIPLVELRNDAINNLVTTLLLVGDHDIPEVCIYFNGRLLRGNRSMKMNSTGFDAFDSPNFPHLGDVAIHVTLHEDLFIKSNEPKFTVCEFNPDSVAVLTLHPGFSTRLLDAALDHPDLKGIVLQTYGVGNPPDANIELMNNIEKASADGITFLNLTQCIRGRVHQGAYETGSRLNKMGVIAGSDLTLEAAVSKLYYLSAQNLPVDQLRKQLAISLCGEMS